MTMSAIIEDDVQRGLVKAPKLTYGYYRQPNGWITVSPNGEMDELKYRREMWEPLPHYGSVEMASEYMADHPLEFLFMNGGAKELPLEQIVAMGLHLNPPEVPTCRQALSQGHKRHTVICWQGAAPVVFPQLEGVSLESFQCRFCSRPPFPSGEARDQHEGVMHKEEKGEIRTGQTLADSLVQGLRGAGALVNAQPISTGAGNHPYLCGSCGEGFDNHVKLSVHFKEQHKGE